MSVSSAAEIAKLKSQRKAKKRELKTFQSRRDEVLKIISNIDNKLSDDISDINSRLSESISSLKTGLQSGDGVTKGVCDSLNNSKESANDSNLFQCRDYLNAEKSRCQTKINTLNSEIRSLERQITNLGGTIYFWE